MSRNLLYFLIGIVLLSCGKDNDDVSVSPLDGVWSHESHTCGFSPGTSLENETYTWSLNATRELLVVESSYSGDFFCIPPPGTYTITVNGGKITIESISYDFSISERKLRVSNKPEADGPLFQFIRL